LRLASSCRTAFRTFNLSHDPSFAEKLKTPIATAAAAALWSASLTRFSTVEIDFIADDPGPSLLHCHHQDHQDEGFMGLVTYL